MVDIKLFFVPEASAKTESRSHFLQLEYYGDEETQGKQKREKRVRSEVMESIEFNEPTEALYNVLTGEEQWVRPKSVVVGGGGRGGKGGKGKGRATEVNKTEVNSEGTVELPETGGVGGANPFNKEHEKALVGMLWKKIEEVEVARKAEDQRIKEILARLDELRRGGGGSAADLDALQDMSIGETHGGDKDEVMAEA